MGELLGIDSEVKLSTNEKVRSINFDNAATTPPLQRVVESICEYSNYYGSIGRGAGQKAEFTTKVYNESRDFLLDFFNIKNKEKYNVIYVNNTTDGINKLSRILINSKEDIVLSTRMEHHSNDLPWRKACKVDYVGIDKNGRLKIKELKEKLEFYKGRVKYVTLTGASNVTGYINPINKIAKIVHKYKAKIIVDGAQLVPHIKVDMGGKSNDEEIDFLIFSAHKFYAPFGVGAIIGRRDLLDKGNTANEGGGTVNIVMDKCCIYLPSPEKHEAGTPNFFGIVAMVTALKELSKIGFQEIEEKEFKLKKRLMDGLLCIPEIKIYGDIFNYEDTLGISVFNINNIEHQKVAETLAKDYGIAIRQGWFCAHPYCRRLMRISEKQTCKFLKNPNVSMPGMIRVSFGMYNNTKEVDFFLEVIEKIVAENH